MQRTAGAGKAGIEIGVPIGDVAPFDAGQPDDVRQPQQAFELGQVVRLVPMAAVARGVGIR